MPSSSATSAASAKIGLLCYPGMGHVNPMAALGSALQRRGHSVHFIQVLDLQAPIEAAGLSFIPLGPKTQPRGHQRKLDDEVAKLTGIPVMDFTVQRLVDTARMELDELPDILRNASPPFDALIVDTIQRAPFAVGLHCGVPVVSADLLPALLEEEDAPPFFYDWQYGSPDSDGGVARQRNVAGNQLSHAFWTPVRAVVDAQRRQWGMKESSSINDQWSDQLRIGQVPAFVDFPRSAWTANYHHTGPWIEPAARAAVAFPYERLNGKPLVYASLGTLVNAGTAIFTAIAAAFSTLDVQLVLTTGGGLSPAALSALAGDPILVAQAPQLDLLRRAALVVTHCGINTTLETLSEGVPAVCIPIGFDQPGNARRLERLGVGEIVRLKELSVEGLRAAAVKVLGDAGYRSRAREAAERIKQLRGLDTAVGLVEEFVEKVRSEK